MTDAQPGPFHAIILAAGVGRRLGDGLGGHAGLPKVLLAFDGVTLLARHLRILHQAGVARITIVVGYAAHSIRTALADSPVSVDLVENPAYCEGSVVSLWTARDVLRSGAPILLMDGDVLYDRRMMSRLIGSARPDSLLLDRELDPGDEPVKLCIRDGSIVDFRKKPTEAYDFFGESVGFFRFTPATAAELADRADTYVTTGRRTMEYEEPIRDMLMQSTPDRFGFEDVTGLPWTEIDFPEDVAKAATLLPDLEA